MRIEFITDDLHDEAPYVNYMLAIIMVIIYFYELESSSFPP